MLFRYAADLVTTKFIKPIKLEFEKVYYPYLLISKKRYAGLYWTKPEKYDKMDSKGIEVRIIVHRVMNCDRNLIIQTVRRDNCRLVSTVIETCLHKMLIDRDVKAAEAYVPILSVTTGSLISTSSYTKQVISELLQNKIDMSQLVITKALAKTGAFSPSRIRIKLAYCMGRIRGKTSACRTSGTHEGTRCWFSP